MQKNKYTGDLKQLIEVETGIKFNRNNKACCPIHGETKPSLSYNPNTNKVRCFGKCQKTYDAIDFIREYKGLDYVNACKHLGLPLNETYKTILSEEETIKKYIDWQKKKIDNFKDLELISLYRFADKENKTLYFKAKFKNQNDKELKYYSLDQGKVINKRKGEEVPYNLYGLHKALLNNKPVFICEGEKDADTIKYLGYTASSFKGVKEFDYSIFKNSIVYFVGDTGEAGEQYKNDIFDRLSKYVESFNVIDLPNIEQLGDNKDITDWLSVGHTKEEFEEAKKDSWDWKKSREWKYVIPVEKKDETIYVPLKIWENLEILLKRNNIYLKYNELSKSEEFYGIDFIDNNSALEDIYSLANKNNFKMGKENLASAISRIAKKNKYQPVQEYLNKCLEKYLQGLEVEYSPIEALAETITTPEHFTEDTKLMYITKWLLNACNIAFNDGEYGSEGILVLQGKQGLGKTRWIKSIIPDTKWVKTGLEVDPSDKDKVYQATKYWVSELGELDATLKKDQAKLKAFFTESKDEYRRPYERRTEEYPRMTAFYGSVNKTEFLKDETGNRRYWVIPVTDLIVDHYIPLDELWGEVMYKLKIEKMPYWLTSAEKDILNKNNAEYEVRTEAEIKIEEKYNFSVDKEFWIKVKTTEISETIGETARAVKQALEKLGIKQDRNGFRGYKMPPTFEECNEHPNRYNNKLRKVK